MFCMWLRIPLSSVQRPESRVYLPDPYRNDTVLGFNKSGKEVARIQVEEPIYIRPAERVTWL